MPPDVCAAGGPVRLDFDDAHFYGKVLAEARPILLFLDKDSSEGVAVPIRQLLLAAGGAGLTRSERRLFTSRFCDVGILLDEARTRLDLVQAGNPAVCEHEPNSR